MHAVLATSTKVSMYRIFTRFGCEAPPSQKVLKKEQLNACVCECECVCVCKCIYVSLYVKLPGLK